jgi:hypothetical protein
LAECAYCLRRPCRSRVTVAPAAGDGLQRSPVAVTTVPTCAARADQPLRAVLRRQSVIAAEAARAVVPAFSAIRVISGSLGKAGEVAEQRGM